MIDTGKCFERMALTAREHHIAIHIPQFILRVGYLKKYPDPVSLRRPVSAFVRL